MKKFVMLSLMGLLVATVATADSRTVFRTLMSDETGTGSKARGTAVFQFSDDGSEMSYKLIVNGLENTTMSHIHVASVPGGNGPVVLWLYPDQPPATLIEGIFNGLLGSRTVTESDLVGPLSGNPLGELRAAIEEGRAYVNVHTTAFPGGEIRGTIR